MKQKFAIENLVKENALEKELKIQNARVSFHFLKVFGAKRLSFYY